MGSKKNKRGQQRKADKNVRQLATLSRRISKADNDATVDLILSRDELLSNPSGDITKLGIDIASNMLNFLKCCQDETFDEVLASVGGDLLTPSTWIEALTIIAENIESSRMLIIQNVSPLVRCMCNDMERIFFKSNEHWRFGIKPFAQLIVTVITGKQNLINPEDNDIVHSLLNHDGLLRSIIQWGFWDEHRPDIAMEVEAEDLATIASMGQVIVALLVRAVRINNTPDGPFSLTLSKNSSLMQTIGITPIINKEYDPNCILSYTAGIIRRMKTHTWEEDDITTYNLIVSLIRDRDFVDRAVIAELLGLGHNYSEDCTRDKADLLGQLLNNMLKKENENQISDTRVAFAIRNGLIELWLSHSS